MEKDSSKQKWGYRHIVALIAFLSFLQMNVQRISATVAIVAMINTSAVEEISPSNTSLLTCPFPDELSRGNYEMKNEGEFNWSSDEVGFINGASFFGMFISLLPSGKLTQFFLSKRLIFWAGMVSSAAIAVSPFVSKISVHAFIVALFFRGCGEGIITIAFYVIMANWFPREENGVLSTFCMSGYSVGAIFSGIVSGWICEYPYLGWPAVYYMVAGSGVVLSLLVLIFLYESPKEHPRVSMEELNYIVDKTQETKKKEATPWLKIMTSVPTYALLFAFFGQFWTYSYFWSVNSTFLGTVLHVPIKKNGIYSALPYLFKTIGENFAGFSSHWLLIKGYLGIDSLRKTCTFLGYTGFSGAVVGIYFAGCNGFMSAVFSSLAMFFVGVSTPGSQISCIDMTKKFAGPLSGIMNIAGSSAAFLLPIFVGYLTPNKTLTEWHSVFFLTIIVVMGSGIVYALFGSAEIQPWNYDESEDSLPQHLKTKQDRKEENAKF